MKIKILAELVASILFFFAAIGLLGFAIYKFIGAAGVIGLLFVVLAILGNIMLARAERELPKRDD